jgi:hypothetical protein
MNWKNSPDRGRKTAQTEAKNPEVWHNPKTFTPAMRTFSLIISKIHNYMQWKCITLIDTSIM